MRRIQPTARVVVLGIGNPFRRDDGVGVVVARRVREALSDPSRSSLRPSVKVRVQPSDVTALLEAWRGDRKVVAIDAVRPIHSSGSRPGRRSRPGRIHRFDPLKDPLPSTLFRSSSHLLGLTDALELGRSLGNLPAELVLFGVEGRNFGHGEGLTSEVESAVADATRLVMKELGEMVTSDRSGRSGTTPTSVREDSAS